METENLIILDTDVLIELQKRNEPVVSLVRAIGEKKIAVTKVSVFEMYVGAFNKNELIKIKHFLDKFPKIELYDKIIDLAIELVYEYKLSHSLFINDAIIAASAIYYDLELFTLNIKDYKFIPKLKLYKLN
ncbi:MAG: hypothetical protein HW421_1785 [Ignavibacteria bacterium]|nr:hypothetical protein [Ignavibacteria bacterium]